MKGGEVVATKSPLHFVPYSLKLYVYSMVFPAEIPQHTIVLLSAGGEEDKRRKGR